MLYTVFIDHIRDYEIEAENLEQAIDKWLQIVKYSSLQEAAWAYGCKEKDIIFKPYQDYPDFGYGDNF